MIYKRELKDKGTFQSIEKEAIIYKDILPEIYENLPENIKEKIVFPKILDDIKEDGRTRAIVLEKMEGEICGNHDTTKKGLWDKSDIEAIISVIKEFQNIDPEKIKKAGFDRLPYKDFYEAYNRKFDERSKPIKGLMGDDYVDKAKEILNSTEEIMARQPENLLSEDIFCFNIIKRPNGKNALIDWERPYTGKDISADYGKLISRLWTDPEIQEDAIEAALKTNEDNPDFKKLLKASLMFGEGGHMFKHYYGRLEHEDPAKKQEAEKAIEVFKKIFVDILDNKGVWKD